jgi:hypothetical protein
MEAAAPAATRRARRRRRLTAPAKTRTRNAFAHAHHLRSSGWKAHPGNRVTLRAARTVGVSPTPLPYTRPQTSSPRHTPPGSRVQVRTKLQRDSLSYRMLVSLMHQTSRRLRNHGAVAKRRTKSKNAAHTPNCLYVLGQTGTLATTDKPHLIRYNVAALPPPTDGASARVALPLGSQSVLPMLA